MEDKKKTIKVISDENKGLNVKIAKIVRKADQLQEVPNSSKLFRITLS